MRITIEANGHLKGTSSIGSTRRDYEANQGATVRDLLSQFNICESEVRRIVCNGKRARLDTRLRARDHLEIY